MAGKLKTNKSMAKRIKVTKNNKLRHDKAYKNHLLTNKNKAQRQMGGGKEISKKEANKIKNLIPYKLR